MLTWEEVASAVGAAASGPSLTIRGVATDTRSLAPGALFVALRGQRFDGHAFLAEAATRGAVAALTERPREPGWPPCLVVPDTRRALGQLAGYWRRRMGVPVIAVTGSNGKTSVKELTARIMAATGPGIATQGNLNNDIGLPLTLLRLGHHDRYAVVEIGMNRPGEIAALGAIAHPDVAIVTNAGAAHLAGLGTVQAVAAEKGSLYSSLPPAGVAVINADDAYAGYWRTLAPGPVLTFGLGSSADVSAQFVTDPEGSDLHITAPAWDEPLRVRLPLLGAHNVVNALAATAAALALGASAEAVAQGLAGAVPVAGRLQSTRAAGGAWLIDDSYNANPDSARAALAVLAALPGERWFVLGDMAELGVQAPSLHADFGAACRRAGIEHLWTLGPLSQGACAAFGANGRHYETHDALVQDLQAVLHPNAVVLVKGSRSMGMDAVTSGLRAAGGPDVSAHP